MSIATAPLDTNNLEAFWMPFTANRQFKKDPRLFVGAEGMYYLTYDGRRVLDGAAGLWCVNAGHCHKRIVAAVQKQVATMDFAPAFQMGHPMAFELASRLTQLTPGDLNYVFFANSGSEAVDTALKIAVGYHRARGEGQRTRLIGRERGYHGIGFGGTSVGGIKNNRKMFSSMMLPGVDHMPHTHDPAHMAFSRGQPEWGAHLADDLLRLIDLHDASTIAAVIVEPVAGSTGVLPPPKGYLERLRKITEDHGILLIFDEVITGFGRLGAAFAAEKFGIVPDMMTIAKGLTNATVPASAVVCREGIYQAFMQGPEWMVELFHGYTYSAHPLAVAAGLATLDVYRDEGLFERAADLSPYWEDAVHSLKGLPNVIDLRNLGLMAGVDLAPRPGKPTLRGYDVFLKCYERGVYIRYTGDTLAMSPPLIAEKSEIDKMFSILAEVIKEVN
ncbi:MAG: aspartate aminotransferase family protein [Alphaproteobacteria bacterium]|nr:aspartate aminotransferase family protein [Alphaproteobacteria bacterium]